MTYGHDGDPNTGVNIPAADQVDLVAGGTVIVHGLAAGLQLPVTPKMDTIAELTPGAGITLDGVKMLDNDIVLIGAAARIGIHQATNNGCTYIGSGTDESTGSVIRLNGTGFGNPNDIEFVVNSSIIAKYSHGITRWQFDDDILIGDNLEIDGDLNHDGAKAGFFATAPINKPTGVAVSSAGIHAALVSLGLIAA